MMGRPPRSTLFPYTTPSRSPHPPNPLNVGDGQQQLRETHPSWRWIGDRKSTRLNSSHLVISHAVFCFKKKTKTVPPAPAAPRSDGPCGRLHAAPPDRYVAAD